MKTLYCEHACGIPIEVRLYATLDTMWRGMARFNARTKPEKFSAVTYSTFKEGKLAKIIVMFNLENMGAGIVSHEFCHVTFSLVRHVGKMPQSRSVPIRCNNEEFFASCHENVTKMFWNWFYDQFPERAVN